MDKDRIQFDDPALKAALKTRIGAERAPDHLRARVASLLAQSPSLSDAARAHAREAPGRNPFFRFLAVTPLRVAAGLLLFGLVLTTYFLLRPTPAVPMESGLLLAMIKTHDYCCNHTFHQHPDLDDQDFDKMQEQAAGRLSHPVVATPIEGWQFKGIYLCPVGDDGRRSAHLLFHRGAQRLSLFTIADPNPSTEPKQSATQINDRLIAAMSEGGTAFGIVAHPAAGPLSLEDIKKLLRQHAVQLTRPSIALISYSPQPVELLR